MFLPLRCYLLLFITILLISSCANYKLNYAIGEEKWSNHQQDSSLKLHHSIYLIGDTGNAKMHQSLPTFQYLKRELARANEKTSIIFLGDNIYPVGMPPKNDDYRALAEHKLNVQLDILQGFKGKIMFIPGNHDWMKYGKKGVERQEKYIEKTLNAQRGIEDKDNEDWVDYFLPSNACGEPELVEINDQLVVVLIDSEWWLQNWDTQPSINEGCEIQSRATFKFQFEELLRKYRDRNVVIAMHHPLYSYGQHGGYLELKKHLFPLTSLNENLYMPLPGVGPLSAFFRANIGFSQDLANGKYQAMKADIMASATKNGRYIFAAGHEHTLQYIEKDQQHFIVSGAGSKENAVRLGSGSQFAYGKMGYSKLDFYEDGSTWVSFFVVNEIGTVATEVFRKKIKERLTVTADNVPTKFPEYEQQLVEKVRRPNNYDLEPVGWLHKLTFGEHYLPTYLRDYAFPVLDLDTLRGGMTPIKRGGGNQTNSLRLKDAKGKQFTMRALTKDASRALPYPINQMDGAEAILKDNFLAAYPFAALIVPKMADAAKVYHANPKLYYVPKQPALGYHNDLFGGDVYLLEERLGGNWEENASLGNSKKLISTLDVVEKMTKNHKHRIDQNWVVRSRLFDLLIRDWDRHDDQWRWATLEDEQGKYYRPIPRDRDQAFARYDGFLTKLIGKLSPFYRQLQNYSPDVKDIRWESWNAKYFDTNFLSALEREDWLKEAHYIQEQVTDEVIDAAFAIVPKAAQDERWQQMRAYTKQRRDQLVTFAEAAYEYNTQEVDVLDTNKRDLFQVKRLSTNQTHVQVFALSKSGEPGKLLYERTFEQGITKEIHLYGLEGNDIFRVEGTVKKGILVRIVGGEGEDHIEDTSDVKRGRKKTRIYDYSTEDNTLDLGKEGRDKTSTRTAYNSYVRKHNHYHTDFGIPFPVVNYNQDDALILGLGLSYFNYRFKKFPYGESHRFRTDWASSPQAFEFSYRGEIIESFGKWDIISHLNFRGNRYSFNYFGLGNETENPDPDDLVFNRVRQERAYANIGVRRRFAHDKGSLSITPLIERTEIDATPNRFLTNNSDAFLTNIFDPRWYLGLNVRFDYESLDQQTNPNRGMRFQVGYNMETTLNDLDYAFAKFGTGLTVYTPLDASERLVFATEFGYEGIRGSYDFFKAPTIGGGDNLRGFRAERFRGERVFYHNNDLRFKLLTSINRVFPFTLGIHGGFDYGRTWSEDENSEKWHSSYGGGLWLEPVNAIVLSFGQYFSAEDHRFVFTLGHQF
ncbi:MAG: BamA/TamA family outer membrane protein [Bacteroidota bacterium]